MSSCEKSFLLVWFEFEFWFCVRNNKELKIVCFLWAMQGYLTLLSDWAVKVVHEGLIKICHVIKYNECAWKLKHDYSLEHKQDLLYIPLFMH